MQRYKVLIHLSLSKIPHIIVQIKVLHIWYHIRSQLETPINGCHLSGDNNHFELVPSFLKLVRNVIQHHLCTNIWDYIGTEPGTLCKAGGNPISAALSSIFNKYISIFIWQFLAQIMTFQSDLDNFYSDAWSLWLPYKENNHAV